MEALHFTWLLEVKTTSNQCLLNKILFNQNTNTILVQCHVERGLSVASELPSVQLMLLFVDQLQTLWLVYGNICYTCTSRQFSLHICSYRCVYW